MLALPILNVHLQACPASWPQMTPTPQGRHCAHCNREVVDFTNSTTADLEAARAAAPDGRLCGRFRQSQLAATLQLRPKLRRFLVALVLVCGLGLSGREALAQVRAGTKATTQKILRKQNAVTSFPIAHEPLELPTITLTQTEEEFVGKPYVYVNQQPAFPGGIEAMQKFLAQYTHYPKNATKSGNVYVNFVVGPTGQLMNVHIQKQLEPALDTEALRVVQLMPCWTPGLRNGRPVDVRFTLPVPFANDSPPVTQTQ